MRFVSFIACLLVFSALPVNAAEISVGEGLLLSYDLPKGWSLHLQAPEPLVMETAEHVAHEAEEQGKHPSQEQILQVARKRLAANEAIIYHVSSGSHLDIDFSPLEENEKPPGTKLLKTSTEYAAQSLQGEEGISGVEFTIRPVKITGSLEAFRLDARYHHHDLPVRFIGIVGYANRHWFFFYFSAPGENPEALQSIEPLISSLTIKPAG